MSFYHISRVADSKIVAENPFIKTACLINVKTKVICRVKTWLKLGLDLGGRVPFPLSRNNYIKEKSAYKTNSVKVYGTPKIYTKIRLVSKLSFISFEEQTVIK